MPDDLAAYFDAHFAPPLEQAGIKVTAAARDLFVRTAMAQVEAGIVPPERILAAVRNMDLTGLADFYLLKFGPLPLSYNRMLRLLGDMHDSWIVRRHAEPGTEG